MRAFIVRPFGTKEGIDFNDVDVEPYPADMFYSDLMRVTEGLADPMTAPAR